MASTPDSSRADPPGLDDAIDGFRRALRDYVRGDPEPALTCFSDREDVTLVVPPAPARLGFESVAAAVRRAATDFADGGPLRCEEVDSSVEEVVRVAGVELAYVLQLERHDGRLAASGVPMVIVQRATVVFRREGEAWKVSHRHADPLLSRPAAGEDFQD